MLGQCLPPASGHHTGRNWDPSYPPPPITNDVLPRNEATSETGAAGLSDPPKDPGLLTGPGCKGQSTWVAPTQQWPRPPGLGHPPYNHHAGASQHGLYWDTPNVSPIGLPGTGLQTSSSARASGNNGLLSNFQSPPPAARPPAARHPRATQQFQLNPRFKRNSDGTEPPSSRIPKRSRSGMDVTFYL